MNAAEQKAADQLRQEIAAVAGQLRNLAGEIEAKVAEHAALTAENFERAQLVAHIEGGSS